MKKLKHEAELFKAALLAGIQYAEGRKAVEFESTDSASDNALYVYRLLVHDKVISPMPEDQVGEKTIRHRLANWYGHQLPDGHPLFGIDIPGRHKAALRSLASLEAMGWTPPPSTASACQSGSVCSHLNEDGSVRDEYYNCRY